MPWSFRRSKKIGGLRVNIGKRGLTSVSTGGRLFGQSLSKRGVRQRVTLPGTGISYRSKASGCALVVAAVALLLASLACGSGSRAARPTATPTRTPRPSPTLIPLIVVPSATAAVVPPTATIELPTATVEPTVTAEPPTATAEPTAAPTAAPPPTAVPVRAVAVFACPGGCAVAPDPSCAIKGNVNSDGERIYHRPGWRDYNRVKMRPDEGDVWVCTPDEASAAGFRPAQQ